MSWAKYIFPLNEAEEKVVHGWAVRAKVLLNDLTSGTRNFSLFPDARHGLRVPQRSGVW